MGVETLNEQDIESLTRIENQLIRMRKREAANKNFLCCEFTEAIEEIHEIRRMLQARMNLPIDKAIEK